MLSPENYTWFSVTANMRNESFKKRVDIWGKKEDSNTFVEILRIFKI